MILDFSLIAGSAGLGAAAVALLAQWRHRRDSARDAASVREAVEKYRVECSEQVAGLIKGHEAVEASLQSTRDVLRHGRLNRSVRAQALQMLRSGVSPDTAGASLGLAKREIRLLARVSQLLAQN